MQTNAVTVAQVRQENKVAKKIRTPRRVKVAALFGWKCYWCEQTMCEEFGFMHSCTIEHLVPRSKGGTNMQSNFAAACHRCNCLRGTIEVHVFAMMARDLKPDRKAIDAVAKKNKRARWKRRRADQAAATRAFRTNTGHLLAKDTRAHAMYCKMVAQRGPTGLRGAFRKLVNLASSFFKRI